MGLVEALAQLESARWSAISAKIPVWHPRNEAGVADPPPADPPPTAPPESKDPEVAKTYERLREAEKRAAAGETAAKERDALAKRLAKLERDKMSEEEKKTQDQKDSNDKIAALQARLDAADLKENVGAIATEMKFKNPGKAHRFIPAGVTDEKGVREALEETAKDYPELIGTGPAPPPVNGPGPGNQGSQNSRMNAEIRRASGRR